MKRSSEHGARKSPGHRSQTNLIELSVRLLVAGDALGEKFVQFLPDATGGSELTGELGMHFRYCGRCCKEYSRKKLGAVLTREELTV